MTFVWTPWKARPKKKIETNVNVVRRSKVSMLDVRLTRHFSSLNTDTNLCLCVCSVQVRVHQMLWDEKERKKGPLSFLCYSFRSSANIIKSLRSLTCIHNVFFQWIFLIKYSVERHNLSKYKDITKVCSSFFVFLQFCLSAQACASLKPKINFKWKQNWILSIKVSKANGKLMNRWDSSVMMSQMTSWRAFFIQTLGKFMNLWFNYLTSMLQKPISIIVSFHCNTKMCVCVCVCQLSIRNYLSSSTTYSRKRKEKLWFEAYIFFKKKIV